MSLDAGGHLTHGAPANVGQVVQAGRTYGVRRQDGLIDYRRGRSGSRSENEAEADHRRRLGLFAHHRLRALPRRSPTRSAPCSWSTWRTSPAWSRRGLHPPPAAARARRHHHDAQDAARPARRHDPHQRRGHRQEDELGGLPRPPGRTADARDRRQGGGVRRGAAAGVQALRPARGRQRQGAGRHAARSAGSPSSRAAPTAT